MICRLVIYCEINAQQFNFVILYKQNKSYNYSTLKQACKKTYMYEFLIWFRNDTNKNRQSYSMN